MKIIDNIISKKFFAKLEQIKYGSINITTPEGKEYNFEGSYPGIKADLQIKKWSVISRLSSTGDIAFAEDYRDQNFTTSNLLALLKFALSNDSALENYIDSNILARLIHRIRYYLNTNTIKQSKRNIHKHYDLGNNFYRLWLDDSMSYSSAIFTDSENDLQIAQYNKYDRIIDHLTKGKNTLEIGCGWGGFVDRAMQKNDYNIKGITISKQQYEYAQKRVGNKANIAIEDYRHLQGRYDNIVSIEMFEAVGEKYWQTYFAKIKNLLQSKGKAMIQTITIRDDLFQTYRKGSDMIRSFIFPGGMLPSESIFKRYAMESDLRVNDVYNFGSDYAKTLEIWLDRFDSKLEQIKMQGFDDKFIRIWRFYLASCAACFDSGRTNVMQVELENV